MAFCLLLLPHPAASLPPLLTADGDGNGDGDAVSFASVFS
jgi:hypothetical protein